MDYEWIQKPIRKRSDQKIEKKSKHRSQIAPSEQKIKRESELSNTVLSLMTQNHSLFRSTSCFCVAKITLQIDFKNHENK